MQKYLLNEDTEFITLGQLLKELGIIPTGGAAKWFLAENPVKIDGEFDDRRGRKLYRSMTIEIEEGLVIEIN
ncbi:MAG: S4 domain-containing protein YaaA [Lactobacillales bacterium]|nr:S4 domain-containing protein YaaA [Lactobacillales bacterium]